MYLIFRPSLILAIMFRRHCVSLFCEKGCPLIAGDGVKSMRTREFYITPEEGTEHRIEFK
jgi:hypothetical protein